MVVVFVMRDTFHLLVHYLVSNAPHLAANVKVNNIIVLNV